MIRPLALALSSWGVLVVLASCTGITQPQDVNFPDSNVSYIRHMQPFLSLSCATGGCHDKSEPAGGIDLTDYSGLHFSRPNLVVSYKPDESLIMQSIDQTITHRFDIMSRVTANQRLGVRRWILEGALLN